MENSAKNPHPDLLALDALRADEGTLEDRAHVAGCDACKKALIALEHTASELRDYASGESQVPVAVDEAIFARASVALRRMRDRGRVRIQRWIAASAAACVLGAVVLFVCWPAKPEPGIVGAPTFRPPSAGAVDIVDAYRLARQLRSGDAADSAWDWNQDGVVDVRDVDDMAKQSVSLSRRPR